MSLEHFLDPYRHDFMLYAFTAAALISAAAGALSYHLNQRGVSFLGDALAHSALPGLAIASYFKIPLILGALTTSLLGIAMITQSKVKKLYKDSLLALYLSFSLSLGFIIIHLGSGFRGIHDILFGSILSISGRELPLLALVSFVVLAAVIILRKELLITLVDRDFAAQIGLNIPRLELALFVLSVAVVVSSIHFIGLVMTIAIFVAPGIAAAARNQDLHRSILFSILFAVVFTHAGLLMSYYLSWPAGATCALCLSAGALVWLGR